MCGWTFDGLQVTVQQHLRKDLSASGHAKEATEG